MSRLRSLSFSLAILIWSISPLTAQLPPSFPEVTVNVQNEPAPGYIFLSNFTFNSSIDNVPYLMVLDNSGWPVHYLQVENSFNMDFKLQPDGLLSYHDMSEFVRLDAGFEPVGAFRAGNGWNTDGHELRVLPNGHALLLGWKIRIDDMTAYGGWPNAMLQDNVIQEVDSSGTVYWEWNAADHFDIEDATWDINLTSLYIDWVHINAVEIDTDGNILISSRHLDEITKIDRTTGEIIWRLGGKACRNNQFTFIDDYFVEGADTLFYGFSHQHAIRRLDNGNILIFDNGNLKDPQYSRAVEYALDEENKTATKVWEYRNSPDIYSEQMGSTQRLPNGNTLIGWGGNQINAVAVTEVRPDGTKVFELSLPEEVVSYRAFRYVFDMAAVTRTVSQPSTYDFNEADNETAVSVDVTALTGSGEMTVQRHDYTAHDPTFTLGNEPDSVFPYRWTITWTGISGLDAVVRLDLAQLAGIEPPGYCTLYRRSIEGDGTFESLETSYDEELGELGAPVSDSGELIVGLMTPTGDIAERAPVVRHATVLEQNIPNPFNPTTTIRFSVDDQAGREVELAIFSLRGRRVRTLISGSIEGGTHSVIWDGRNERGESVSSGVYIYRLTAGGGSVTRKMVIAE